jgi:hypothetical protein
MFDNTVVVKLVRVTDGAVMSMHTRTSGAGVLSQIVYNDDPAYQTHFRRTLLIDPNTSAAPTTSASYKAKVYVLDVDNNLVFQAESEAVTF